MQRFPALMRQCPREKVTQLVTTRLFSSDRLHSTDIAFKPNEDGWGFTKKYSQGYDKIFQKGKSQAPSQKQEVVAKPDVALVNSVMNTIEKMDAASRDSLLVKLKEKFRS